jgi:hypothetical protein
MKTFRLKIVANIIELQELGTPSKNKFTDLNFLMMHINKHKLKIENPQILPENFQKMLENHE